MHQGSEQQNSGTKNSQLSLLEATTIDIKLLEVNTDTLIMFFLLLFKVDKLNFYYKVLQFFSWLQPFGTWAIEA